MDTGFTVFLDFDGVLVTKYSTESLGNSEPRFDPECVENFKHIIERLKAKYGEITIIVASNWRFNLNEGTITELLLEQYELDNYLTAANITFLDRLHSKIEGIMSVINEKRLTPSQSVILDDEYLGEELAAYQIRTRSEDGIRDLESLELIILNR
ncbi:HAD domain-containing protein [Cohnella sp. AR92]|uniref:HAD domain-containing protein n=1 Tax=Cohnella sp. AR92 TaxID=648716 RepID=UPI000F8CA057|nr:HAD domain-containing protein [Cohnella sp. AR92]RUS44616.1 hypothetical protein ELR57_22805 [Cohnella sp. AR92]